MKRVMLWSALLGTGAWLVLRRQRQPVDLHGKVVLITGASAGIGRATAVAFAKHGAALVLVARRAEVLDEVAAELQPYNVPVVTIPADVTNDEQLQRVVEVAHARFGKIDVLVNNAGISAGGPLHKTEPETISRLLEVNLHSMIRLTQLVLPRMLQRHSGHIVNVGSVAGSLVAPGQTIYGASKAAVYGFSESLRREAKLNDVHVSTVLPSWTETAMIAHLDREAVKIGTMIPIQSPEFVAQKIVDAVRFNHGVVQLGGALVRTSVLLQRILPAALRDAVYESAFDSRELTEALSDLGSR